MKNISLILNVVLLLLVGHLYIRSYSNNAEATPENEAVVGSPEVAETDNQEPVEAGAVPPGNILCYNQDSVLQNYKFTKLVESRLKSKRDKMEKEVRARAEKIENKKAEFQQKIQYQQFKSEGEAIIARDAVIREEENFQKYVMGKDEEFRAYEVKQDKEIKEAMIAVLDDLRADRKVDYIMQYTRSFYGNVVYANEDLDITDIVLVELNKRYDAKYPAKAKAKK